MTQPVLSKMSRQARRAHERTLVRKTMTKQERREYNRMPEELKKEIFEATLELVSQHQHEIKVASTDQYASIQVPVPPKENLV